MYEVDQYTISLLHFEDGMKDETGKVWTVNGQAATSTTQMKFGKSALYLGTNGSSIWLQSPLLDLCKSPYTIEMWFYPTSYAGGVGDQFGVLAGFTGFSDSYTGGAIEVCKTTDNGRNQTPGTITASPGVTSTDKVSLNSWNHVALTFDGVITKLFLNGKIQGTSSAIRTVPNLGSLIVGRTAGGYSYQFYGYIDELRISNIARWDSDFKPSDSINVTTNLVAVAGDSKVTLSWTAVTGATGYNVKRSTTVGGPYTTVCTTVTAATYVDTAVTNGTTYYYVVTALNGTAESGNSNEASATPKAVVIPPTPVGNALLRITMNDSSEREYKLSSVEIDSFITWFSRTIGTGTTEYMFNDPVDNSKEYLSFEKIISFKVVPLAK